MKILDRFNLKTVKKAIMLMGNMKKIYLLCIMLFCAVEIIGTALISFGMKGIINSLIDKNIKMFWYSLSLIILKNILWWCYAPISSYFTSKASIDTICEYKSKLCEHIFKLPMSYHDKKSKGEYLTLLTSDTDGLKSIYDRDFFQVVLSFLGGIGGIAVMIIMDYKFAIVVIGFGLLSIHVSSIFAMKLKKISIDRQKHLENTNTDIYELVKACKTIRILNAQNERKTQIEKALDDEKNIKKQFGSSVAKMKAYETLISKLSYIALLIIGSIFVFFDLSDWGTVAALLGIKFITDMIFVECGQFMSKMQKQIICVERLFDIQALDEEKFSSKAYSFKNQSSALSIENISFRYKNNCDTLETFNDFGDGLQIKELKQPYYNYYSEKSLDEHEHYVLSNFSLELPDKSFTALLGESGGGKSTILKLLMGLYEPDEGIIVFAGNDTTTLNIIRQKTSYVPQESMLFYGTIYDNIKFGNENADFDDIIKASKLAGAHEFINKLNNTYNYVLSDDGNNLSGGQKKRIAIARALVKNADILLLDEITSALDYSTEEQILQAIKEISKHKTVLFVTHNKDIVKYADKIVSI